MNVNISYQTWLAFGIDQGWVTVNQDNPVEDQIGFDLE